MAGNTGKFAAGGAIAGSAFGPVGTAVGGVVGGAVGLATDIYGSNKQKEALARAQAAARSDLTQGYADAQGYQQPIYDIGTGAYADTASKYKAGGFNLNPEDVFKDPEYQAQMRSGNAAINSGAESKGNLFSTANQRSLTNFGQDVFAGRSDELQNRLDNRFNQGMTVAQPGFHAADVSSANAVSRGQDFANNSLGSGVIRAKNIADVNASVGEFGESLGSSFGGGAGGLTSKLGKGGASYGSSGAGPIPKK